MKKRLTRTDWIILAVLLALVAAVVLLATQGSSNTQGTAGGTGNAKLSDYAGKNIGSVTGTTYDEAIEANIPDAKISYYSSYGDILTALLTGKIDGFCVDEPVLRYMMLNSDGVSYLQERMETYGFAYAFPKTAEGKALCDEFSAFIEQGLADGTLRELDEKWFGPDESVQKSPDLKALSADRGTLKLIVNAENPPFDHMADNGIAGLEIDIAYLFCQKNGYGLQLLNSNFDAILPSIQSGVADFGASCITPTEERAESVHFSTPHYEAGAVLAVRAADVGVQAAQQENKNIFRQIADSFEKNFIREARWKLVLQGIGCTCLITVLSALFGTVLAFLICLLRRADSVLANKICDFYVRVLQGTPMVVLLMILFYIIFARSGISAVAVAIIGFTLNFSAYASEIMRSGIGSIDPGQREAALAMGYTENQAFFRFIFPQAAVHFLPVYRGEIVSLLKNTSIVGYIAIQDLTKMGDIIRSRTYEPFFPLIATALIYFLLAWLLSLVMRWIMARVDYRKNSRKAAGKEADAK